MIKAYAEPKGHFVEVKLTNEELSDPDDRFNNRYILVKSITKRHYDTVWVEALIINEDINIEYQLCDYMMWFSEESIYRYHKVYNVFELEGQNGHKVV